MKLKEINEKRLNELGFTHEVWTKHVVVNDISKTALVWHPGDEEVLQSDETNVFVKWYGKYGLCIICDDHNYVTDYNASKFKKGTIQLLEGIESDEPITTNIFEDDALLTLIKEGYITNEN